MKNKQQSKLGVIEMKMLTWSSGQRRQGRVRNTIIRKKIGVTSVELKIVESCPSKYGQYVEKAHILISTYTKARPNREQSNK